MFRWRIYYEGGGTFSDADGKPWESPAYGAVAIGQPNNPAFNAVLVNGPYFLWRSDWGCWMEVQLDGLLDQLTHRANEIAAVRVGRYIRQDEWKTVMRRVHKEVRDAT